tara:strand:+ start:42 stop:416 length:375 start_codon:yes stop_codon:yes gene_type:complete
MKFLKYILLLLAVQINAQSFVNEKEFDSYIKKSGVFVVEFWAEWNKKNECKYLKDLEECNIKRVCIVSSKALAQRFKVDVLPTIVIINNEQEVFRIKGNLLFKLETEQKEVQAKIDSIIISKFE